MSLPLSNRTNQDYVAEAVAAIPHWLAFLDEMEAEQDKLIAEMRAQHQGTQAAPTAQAATSAAQATPTPQARAAGEEEPAGPEGQPMSKVVAETPVLPPSEQRSAGVGDAEASSPPSAPAGPVTPDKVVQASSRAWTGHLRKRGGA